MTSFERPLCLDIGTKMGWAFWSPETGERSGWYDLSAFPLYAQRGIQFAKWLTWAVEDKFQPDLVVIEEPFLSNPKIGIIARHWMHYSFVRVQEIGQELINEGWAGRMQVLTPGTYKEHATGSGGANKKKVRAAVNANGGRNIKSEDEADAVAMLCYIREQHKIGPDHAHTGRQFTMTELVA
ncbi:MAG: hypothetical protein OES69_02380 [Myxococcales bacterium]|nr:hypothetical protein [Myxococcales bacterium]